VILGAGVVDEGRGVEVCEITPAANVKTAATIVRGAVECCVIVLNVEGVLVGDA
jgi:hypothetical protein